MSSSSSVSTTTAEGTKGPNGEVIVLSCSCTNVRISGTVRESERVQDYDHEEEVYLSGGSEESKHPLYVGYDAPDSVRTSRRTSSTDNSGQSAFEEEVKEPVWRICWLCDTKLYRMRGKRKGDPAVEDGVVMVDRQSGVRISSIDDPAQASEEHHGTLLSPYSRLNLPLPSSSHFGRPPQESLTTVYPPSHNSPSSSNRRGTYLPRIPDPFFLPPPFIPSHPHLHNICTSAVDYLQARHREREDEVKNFIDAKAREMRELQEKVRAEVEFMWERYAGGPGREEVRERERRRSESIGGNTERRDRIRGSVSGSNTGSSGSGRVVNHQHQQMLSPATEQPSDNPILREAALSSTQNGTSLLSASISHMSYIPQATATPDEADDTIEEVARMVDKKGDQRAVAMSYVFSTLDGAMAGRSVGVASAGEEAEGEAGVRDIHGKDSWIEGERNAARARRALGANTNTNANAYNDGEGEESRTPRARTVKELSSPKKERKGSLLADGNKAGREKGKGKVSFEEPVQPVEDDEVGDDSTQGTATVKEGEDDDYVFDFELEDRDSTSAPASTPQGKASGSTSVSTGNAEVRRTQNAIERTLSAAYASHIPSHRSAKAGSQANRPDLYSTSLRRRDTDDLDSDSTSNADESNISKLATSVPVAIALPGRNANGHIKSGVIHPFERKTSLSDREGVLVPPLIKAMRQRGVIPPGNSLGLSSPTKGVTPVGSRKASISRSRERGRAEGTFADVGDEEGVGTLRENKGFIPPHVLARKESLQSKDVGWRSMISD